MSEPFDFDLAEAQFDDLNVAVGVPDRCWQCDFLHQRQHWPGYEQWVLDDLDEWHVLPGRYDFGEPCEVQHYCARLQCWRDPDSEGCDRGVCVA